MRAALRGAFGILALTIFAAQSNASFIIDDAIFAEISVSSTVDVMFELNEDAFMAGAELLPGMSRNTKRTLVMEHRKAGATSAQAPLLEILKARSISYRAFWITNVVAAYGINEEAFRAVLRDCANKPCGLVAVKKRPFYRRNDMPNDDHKVTSRKRPDSSDIQPNIARVRAPDAWNLGYNGTGVVVGTLDGGVRYTHHALVSGYRGTNSDGTFSHDFNWHDWAYSRSYPDDDDGHGTNVQGIATGSLGVGVAPGARWISGKIFNAAGYAAGDWILAGVEWIMCPTRVDDVNGTDPDCSKGADIVSCSWGIGEANPALNSAVKAWLNAGMIPIFAVGNAGTYGCQTSESPADYSGVIGVGASEVKYQPGFPKVDIGDDVCAFSSLGPAFVNGTGHIFSDQVPSLVAPGYDIEGPSYQSDTQLEGFTGTSQAAPHVAGAAALILGANPDLSPDAVAAAIFAGTNKTSLQKPSSEASCGGVPWTTYPNFIAGYGQLDCLGALKNAL